MRKILLGAVLLSLAPALAHALSVSVQEVAPTHEGLPGSAVGG
jgi:hypothetical protein